MYAIEMFGECLLQQVSLTYCILLDAEQCVELNGNIIIFIAQSMQKLLTGVVRPTQLKQTIVCSTCEIGVVCAFEALPQEVEYTCTCKWSVNLHSQLLHF